MHLASVLSYIIILSACRTVVQLRRSLIRHLKKQQVRQLLRARPERGRRIIAVTHPIIAQDVTAVQSFWTIAEEVTSLLRPPFFRVLSLKMLPANNVKHSVVSGQKGQRKCLRGQTIFELKCACELNCVQGAQNMTGYESRCPVN